MLLPRGVQIHPGPRQKDDEERRTNCEREQAQGVCETKPSEFPFSYL